MKISGFTVVRNAVKFAYPTVESIKAILPICDEFVVNVGDSEDDTLQLIQSINSPKLRIIQRQWNMAEGKTVLSRQTNIALAECRGDWAFYVQSDELIHEADLPYLKRVMQKYVDDKNVDALRFQWMHFYGSYYRYRIDSGWFQKQDRIIRNNGEIESYGDAYAFQRKDGKPLRFKQTYRMLYHYGWVHSGEIMTQRRVNAEEIGFAKLSENERSGNYSFGDLNRFPVYFGSHPAVMKERVEGHQLSQEDWNDICQRYQWHPMRWLRWRYKTSKRVKTKIE